MRSPQHEAQATPSTGGEGDPLTVRRIDALFETERSITGRSAEERLAVRQELSAPLVADAGQQQKPGGLIMAAIAAVFAIARVAEMLGEDEDWLWERSIDMFPEDGGLRVYGVGEDVATAFTDDGIETLKAIIANLRAIGRAPLPLGRLL